MVKLTTQDPDRNFPVPTLVPVLWFPPVLPKPLVINSYRQAEEMQLIIIFRNAQTPKNLVSQGLSIAELV